MNLYTISELKQFGINRSLARRHMDYLVEQSWARRCSPGMGSSPWLVDARAIPYLKSRIGSYGRPRIGYTFTTRLKAIEAWKQTGKFVRVAEALGVGEKTARRFLEREGLCEKKKSKVNSKAKKSPAV